MHRISVAFAQTLLVLMTTTSHAWASETYPTKQVRVVVSFQAGGPVDVATRVVGKALGERLGQAVVVENKGGVGGNLAAAEVARAKGDGYTLLSATDSVFTISPALYNSLGYRQQDLTPVINLASTGLMVVTSPSKGIGSIADLIQRGKSAPLNYSSAGIGSPAHLAGLLLMQVTGMQGTHIAYKGAAPAVMAVASGEVDFGILPVPAVLSLLHTGKLKGLAVTGARRSPLASDVPLLREAGIEGVNVTVNQAIFAPRSTPDPILRQLHSEMASILLLPDVRETFTSQDLTPEGQDGATFSAMLDVDQKRWEKVLKAANVSRQ